MNNKFCDGTTSFGQKERVVRELKSILMASTSREKVAADVKLRDSSSSGFISKDKNDDCSNASPECQTNSEEAHQPSPVSVLEPIFYEDNLDDSEDLDFQSKGKQPLAVNTSCWCWDNFNSCKQLLSLPSCHGLRVTLLSQKIVWSDA
ncbi:PREDICTED: uncharacterized protein LOC104742301 isoform X2 [Camelina sativa]|uniref:Uncharacterized protein LOC104742301 isoform X2 n=1 Tax=Camelina sativa TaxID=90675 RepID=A0ABM0VV95_CAMSA|nr:PREDICTED: uncharacterized protein LOC104742301 isoform X2 [Camelina sativa]